MREADGAVIVITPSALESDWVAREAYFLRDRKEEEPTFLVLPLPTLEVSVSDIASSRLGFLTEFHIPDSPAMEKRIEEVVNGLRGAGPPPEPVGAASGRVEWVWDAPARNDTLKRKLLAETIAERLRRVLKEETSFLIHIDGPWGSGKSSLLNLVESELRPAWIVIRFDAWQQSKVGPPWWSLLTTLRQQLIDRLGRLARLRFRILETIMRVRVAGASYVLAFVAAVAVGLSLFLWPRPALTISEFTELAKLIATVGTALGTLWAGSLLVGRFLLWDSARAAHTFELSNSDPMRGVAEHFKWLVNAAGHPVVMFIDDLDRCEAAYVVELLDSVQTLMRTWPSSDDEGRKGRYRPHFAVAADGAWIRSSYDAACQRFAGSVAEPGRPLGHLFLDKLFQLTVTMPALSDERKATYLSDLLQVEEKDRDTSVEEKIQAFRARLEESHDEADLIAMFGEAPPEVREQVASDVVGRLTEPVVEKATEHALQKFSALLNPNPRAMKRFINTYSMARVVLTIESNAVPTDPLALWTVLKIRWPGLAAYLERYPEAVGAVGKADSALPSDVPEQLRSLFADEKVAELVQFEYGGPLTAELIRLCSGLSSPEKVH